MNTDEQEMLRDSVARFVAKEYSFAQRRRIVEAGGFQADVWHSFGENGWIAAAVPEECGGLGGLAEAAIIAQEFGRGLVVEPYLAAVRAAELLQTSASVEQVLADHIAGRLFVIPALTEPAGQGAVGHVATKAAEVAEGFVLDGRKTVVYGAPLAAKLIVSARTRGKVDSQDGISLFLLDADTPGLLIERAMLHDGSIAGDVVLNEVKVPASALIGELHGAYHALVLSTEATTILAGAETIGMMEQVIALCTEHLKTRKQFGVVLGSFQALQHRMADMAIHLLMARSSLDVALFARNETDATERAKAFAAARTVIGEYGRRVCAAGIQLHGGMGMTEEHPVGHYLKRMLILDGLQGHIRRHVVEYAALLRTEAIAT